MNPSPQAPPRLLTGCAALLWGGISGHPIVGLLLAIGAEAHHWTPIRWKFGEVAYQRAWRLSMLLLLIVVTLIWLNGSVLYTTPRTIVWLPLITLPLLFVQNYGFADSLPLASFSHILKKQRQHALRHGLPYRERRANFGAVWVVLALLASALSTHSSHPIFFPSTLLLLCWLLHDRFRHRIAPIAAVVLMLAVAAAGYLSEPALSRAYRSFTYQRHGSPNYTGEWARQSHTSIGALGEFKQSPQILWRLIPVRGELPPLVRVAAYNLYRDTYWSAATPPGAHSDAADFVELNTFDMDNRTYHIAARTEGGEFLDGLTASNPALPRFLLRGKTPGATLLPVPDKSMSIEAPTDKLEMSTYGTLRVEPGHGVIDALVLWGPGKGTSSPPLPPSNDTQPSADLRLPSPRYHAGDVAAVRDFAEKLGLHELPTLTEKVRRLRAEFMTHFHYMRYAANPPPEGGAFIQQFLEQTHRGHCEYFATATVLLLRECGIPARYATGFAVHERDRHGVALLRGIHAHAWALAWDADNQRWVDVDLTPPDWFGRETPRMPTWQKWVDRWQTMIINFAAWRSHPAHFNLLALILAFPLSIAVSLVGYRLWRTRQRMESTKPAHSAHPPSPLERLERPAARLLGPRPLSMSLAEWLVQLRPHLPPASPLDRALLLHQRLRFDPAAPRDQIATTLTKLTRELRRALRKK